MAKQEKPKKVQKKVSKKYKKGTKKVKKQAKKKLGTTKKKLNLTKHTDYSAVVLPKPNQPKKDHSNYKYFQRRAEILQMILVQGHPSIPVHKLAKLYGVSPGQISQDKALITGYICKNYLKPDRVVSQAVVAKQKALQGAIKKEDWWTVNRISNDILKMAFDLKIIEKATDIQLLSQTFQSQKIGFSVKDVLKIVKNTTYKEDGKVELKELKDE